MNLQEVEQRYIRQYTKLATKILNTLRRQPTTNQTKGFTYYAECARRVRLLMTPEELTSVQPAVFGGN
jgi:hypothetical protein